MRYRRRAIYDSTKKSWRTFYENNVGKIVWDKGHTSYKRARKTVSENQGAKRPNDILNREKSALLYDSFKTRHKWQSQTDGLLKKKKLTKQEREKLKELSINLMSYREDDVKKRIRPRKSKQEVDNCVELPDAFCAYHNTTSAQFFISRDDFKRIKGGVSKGIDKKSDLYVTFDGIQKKFDRKALRNIDSFNAEMIDKCIKGRGKIEYTRGEKILRITGLKK